jgi:acetolactate synthase I/II/III large subunit
MDKIKVTDYVADFLHGKGVKQVFELSGGMITHLLDSLCVKKRVQVVSVHHEQAAAFAADACGRMTGVPGVAMATSGPGATNLLTGIASCYFDSSPAVFITGQVNRDEQKGDRAIRQLGFQETDIVSMAAPVTKQALRIRTPEEVPAALRCSFAEAVGGRPGPVLLDIPMDVQRALIEVHSDGHASAESNVRTTDLEPLLNAVASAKRPMILAGGGVRAGRASAAFRRVVDALGMPVVHSLMGSDLLPFDHPCRVGMIGTYGNRWANLALMNSDLLIVVGSRLDVRQTGSRTDSFTQGRTVFHVDCERGEINNRLKGCHGIVCDVRPFLEQLADDAGDIPVAGAYDSWLGEIALLRGSWPDTAELPQAPGINPNDFMHRLSRSSKDSAAYVADVGQHQMWAAQSLELGTEQRFLTSGGMGSMGFGLPAGIGAALSANGRPVVVIAGDGGFQCNIQELQTVVHLKLPLKIVILNNQCHGMVRQFQESYFEARYQSTYWGYSAPDFTRVAAAYGIESITMTDPRDAEGALKWLWRDPMQPQLLQVMIDTFSNSYPKVAFGRAISEMEPFSKPLDMEST